MKLVAIVIALASVALAQDTRDYKEFMDTSVNPCEDFYSYACGQWTPKNSDAFDVISDQRQENRNILKAYYSSLKKQGIQNSFPASKFYHLCLESSLKSDEETFSDYLRPILEISQWPYVNQTFNSSSFDWMQVAAKLRRHQVDTLFRLSIRRNWKTSGQHVIHLAAMKKPCVDTVNSQRYKTLIKFHLMELGVQPKEADSISQEVVSFIDELDSLSDDAEDLKIDPIPLEELIEQFPELKWELYFKTLLRKPVNRSQPIVVQLGSFKKLETLLLRTKPEIIALYQLTRYLPQYYPRMSDVDWINCMDELNTKMPLSAAKDFGDLIKYKDLEVYIAFYAIRDHLVELINKTNWYNTKSKEKIIKNLKDLTLIIEISTGYWNVVHKLEPEFKIEQKYYQQARMALAELGATKEFDQLEYEIKEVSKNLNPLNVNPSYEASNHALEVPIGLLLPPLHRRRGSSLTHVMGSLGSLFGRELAHKLEYDGGNDDSMEPIKLGEIFDTLNKTVPSSEGLRLVYDACLKIKDVQVTFNKDFSREKLFFINYAQVWCQAKDSSRTPQNRPVHKNKVNTAVASLESFAKAFSCEKKVQPKV